MLFRVVSEPSEQSENLALGVWAEVHDPPSCRPCFPVLRQTILGSDRLISENTNLKSSIKRKRKTREEKMSVSANHEQAS